MAAGACRTRVRRRFIPVTGWWISLPMELSGPPGPGYAPW